MGDTISENTVAYMDRYTSYGLAERLALAERKLHHIQRVVNESDRATRCTHTHISGAQVVANLKEVMKDYDY